MGYHSVSHLIRRNLAPTNGDVNAFFGVMLDNLANISGFAGACMFAYGVPADIVFMNMFPGTTLGVMIGCIWLALVAVKLDRDTGCRQLITAIPLGLDAPSSVGMALLVVGPAYYNALHNEGKSVHDAAMEAWYFGSATTVMIGVIKLLLSLVGEHLQKFFHPAGKQGALAGIGLALLGFLQFTSIVEEPVAGWIATWVLLLILLHRYSSAGDLESYRLPFSVPALLASAVLGSVIYYIMAVCKISVIPMPTGITADYFIAGYPRFSNFWHILGQAIARYGPIAIPYAIMVNIGDMTVVAQAKLDGNDYNANLVMISDAVFTIISGIFGGCIQTTLYIGHSTYHKSFKCRSFYSLSQGIFFGVGGLLGYISFLTTILPKPAILPIFIFVGFEIVYGTFHSDTLKVHHGPAVVFALFPAIAQAAQIILSQLYGGDLLKANVDPTYLIETYALSPSIVSTVGSVLMLAHGFINSSLLWGSALGFAIDKKYFRSAIILVICAVLSFFGVIHSVAADQGVYVPWKAGTSLPFQWFGAYLGAAALTIISGYILQKTRHDEYESIENSKLLDSPGHVNHSH